MQRGDSEHPFPDHAIVAPIQLSSTFARAADGTYPGGYVYSRMNNPNRELLEADLQALEGGRSACSFASGAAAAMAVFQSLATGDHVLAPIEAYHGTKTLLREVFPRWGLSCEFIDMTDLTAVRAAVRPTTRLIWVETPSNPRLRITDLAATAALAHAAGALCVCDNTLATPLGQTPLQLGCDLVIHSTTKYLNGHSDVIGGVVVAREDGEVAQRLRTLQVVAGGVPSPFDCWLTYRGMRTLRHRLQAQWSAAQAIAEFLERHAGVRAVHYPGLASHPQHALARQQMRAFGALLAFEVHGGSGQAVAVAAAVRRIHRATSLGGIETFIEHRASMEGAHSTTPPNLLRLAVGLEPVDELIADLAQALSGAPRF